MLVLEPRLEHGKDSREPAEDGHDAILYLMPTAGRDTDEFYANAAIGEFWTGPRPSLAQVAADLGIATRHLDELADVLDRVGASTRIVREADPGLTDQVDEDAGCWPPSWPRTRRPVPTRTATTCCCAT